MNKTLFLGIDFGTGGCKTTVIGETGNILAEASVEYITHHPKPAFSEQNPDDWYSALKHCLQSLKQKDVELKKIGALALDASTHNAVLLDDKMKVIRPVIMWTDQRSAKEVGFLKKGWGEEIFSIAYQQVAPTWTLPQLLWIKNNEPENFRKIDKIMFVKDYVRFLLTGSWETDYIDAQGTLFFDMKNNRWSEKICRIIDLPLKTLPPLCMPTDITGRVTAKAVSETGLAEGTLVICGTTDVTVEDYGAGAIRPGQCIVKLATAGNVNVMTARVTPNPLTLTYSHVVPGIWYTAAATNTAASAMRWFRDNFCFEETEKSKKTGVNAFQILEELVKPIPPGAEGLFFHPYLLGERSPYWDSDLRGSFTGISMTHNKAHFVKAVMEGVAFSLRDCFRLIEDMELDVSELILIGGGAKSDEWSQIICDVFGKKVTRPAVTDASFGSALLAAVGAGAFTDVVDAVQKCVKTDREFTPDATVHRQYRQSFRFYREIHDNLRGIYHKLKNQDNQ